MKNPSLLKSFQHAIHGVLSSIRSERNMRIHVLASIVVIACGCFYHIQKQEWLILFLTMGGVIALEMMNTAIEKTVDLVTNEYRELAKQAKDIAAGAVFLFSCIAVIIGCMIFLPYML